MPRVLVTTLMHAREPASLTVALYWMRHALELYGKDPQATYLLEGREVRAGGSEHAGGRRRDRIRKSARADGSSPLARQGSSQGIACEDSFTRTRFALQVWFVPAVNIDGYIANEGRKDPMIRKNRRPTCPSNPDLGGVRWR